MLPASNRGVGQNLCFPDICNTPTPAGPVPIPYPNIALNMQAVGFSPFVKVSMMNALNLSSKIPVTMGDEAGSASPIKGAGAFSMGNPIVSVDKMPAINLTSLATGNNMNAAIGAAIVPSVVNVFYTRLSPAAEAPDDRSLATNADPYRRAASIDEARELTGSTSLEVERSGTVTTFCVRVLGPEVPGRVFAELDRWGFDPSCAVILDLRQCPGGELDAYLRLAELFLPEGALIARTVDEDGDETEHRSRGGEALSMPLTVLIDEKTASAAELLAGSLRAHGRASLVGTRTYGKSAAQCLRTTLGGEPTFATSLRVLLPDGSDLEGVGLDPDSPTL